MDKEFEDWVKEFDKDFRGSDSYNILVGKGYNPAMLEGLKWYIQYKSGKQTKSLVKATWILAISTIILAIATIALIFAT